MVKVRDFLIVLCFVWMLFDEGHGDVQVYNRDTDGNGARNISVNIHGANGGSICIDCQNQIQVDNGLDFDDPDLDLILGRNPLIPPVFYAQPPLSPILNSMVLSQSSTSTGETLIPLTLEAPPPIPIDPFYLLRTGANNNTNADIKLEDSGNN